MTSAFRRVPLAGWRILAVKLTFLLPSRSRTLKRGRGGHLGRGWASIKGKGGRWGPVELWSNVEWAHQGLAAAKLSFHFPSISLHPHRTSIVESSYRAAQQLTRRLSPYKYLCRLLLLSPRRHSELLLLPETLLSCSLLAPPYFFSHGALLTYLLRPEVRA